MAPGMSELTLHVVVKTPVRLELPDTVHCIGEAFELNNYYITVRDILPPPPGTCSTPCRFRRGPAYLDGTAYRLVAQRRQSGLGGQVVANGVAAVPFWSTGHLLHVTGQEPMPLMETLVRETTRGLTGQRCSRNQKTRLRVTLRTVYLQGPTNGKAHSEQLDHEKTPSPQDTRSSTATGQARQPARRAAGVETRHTARKEIKLRPSRRQHPAGVEAHRRPGQAFRQREEKTGTEFQPQLQTRHAQPRP